MMKNEEPKLWHWYEYKKYVGLPEAWKVLLMVLKSKWSMVFGLAFLVFGSVSLYMGMEEIYVENLRRDPPVVQVIELLFLSLGGELGLGLLSGCLLYVPLDEDGSNARIIVCSVLLFVHSIVFAVSVANCEYLALGISYVVTYAVWVVVCVFLIADAWVRNAIEEWGELKDDAPFTEEDFFKHLLSLIK